MEENDLRINVLIADCKKEFFELLDCMLKEANQGPIKMESIRHKDAVRAIIMESRAKRGLK